MLILQAGPLLEFMRLSEGAQDCWDLGFGFLGLLGDIKLEGLTGFRV